MLEETLSLLGTALGTFIAAVAGGSSGSQGLAQLLLPRCGHLRVHGARLPQHGLFRGRTPQESTDGTVRPCAGVYYDAMVHVWPLTLRDGELALRPLRRRDRAAFEGLRVRNAEWLRPWDAIDPASGRGMPPFRALRRGTSRRHVWGPICRW
ncbi:hypothetical protein [Brachybacterium sp. Z12]|uniref:hypothetical protein n=1 Tax=Brachybacterium sp. Z12 TaxID=2759167 RepID=UPI00292A5B13|nr:hypothetical protein [Brachybacterium sp. Z12]